MCVLRLRLDFNDWRTGAALRRSLSMLPKPIADTYGAQARPVARYVLRLECPHCQQCYLAATPLAMPQSCPDCAGALQPRDTWDLMRQARPAWWDTEVPG